MSVPSLSSVQLSAMKNSRAYGIDKGKGGKSFIYCRVKTQLSTYSSLREPRSSPFVYAKINSLIYGQRTKGSSGHKPYVAFPIWKWNHVTIRIKENVVPLNEAKKNLKVFFFSPKNGMNVTCAFPAQSLFSSRFCSYFFPFQYRVIEWDDWSVQWHEPKRGNEIWSFKEEKPWKSSLRVARMPIHIHFQCCTTPKYF